MDSAELHSVPIPIVLSYKINLIKQLLTPNLQPDCFGFFLVLPALDFGHRMQFCAIEH